MGSNNNSKHVKSTPARTILFCKGNANNVNNVNDVNHVNNVNDNVKSYLGHEALRGNLLLRVRGLLRGLCEGLLEGSALLCRGGPRDFPRVVSLCL